jgi:hypothetical protein
MPYPDPLIIRVTTLFVAAREIVALYSADDALCKPLAQLYDGLFANSIGGITGW